MVRRVESNFFNASDIATLLGVSQSSAYRIIKKLNAELEDMGKITLSGKISRKYFEEKVYM